MTERPVPVVLPRAPLPASALGQPDAWGDHLTATSGAVGGSAHDVDVLARRVQTAARARRGADDLVARLAGTTGTGWPDAGTPLGAAVRLADVAAERYEAALDRYDAAVSWRSASHHLQSSTQDALTGVMRRDAGLDHLRHEVDRARRHRVPLMVAFLDVDGLKRINDSEGHLAGDHVLRAVGTALRRCLRGYDVLIRYGGDEFVCGLPGAAAGDVARRFSQVADLLARLSPGATVTVGLAVLEADDSLEDALKRADDDLYSRRRAALPS